MTPPVKVFPPEELESKVQFTRERKLQKQPIKLKDCQLLTMVQYECEVKDRKNALSVVQCWPVERLFRKYVKVVHLLRFADVGKICRCANGLMVETTSWEDLKEAK